MTEAQKIRKLLNELKDLGNGNGKPFQPWRTALYKLAEKYEEDWRGDEEMSSFAKYWADEFRSLAKNFASPEEALDHAQREFDTSTRDDVSEVLYKYIED